MKFLGGGWNKSNVDYADAKYVTMGVNGIGPRRENADKLFDYCVALGVDLLNRGTESGTALNIRSNVKTASLKTLSLIGALGLQRLLRIGATWLQLNPDEVSVTANINFADTEYSSDDFIKFSTLVNVGAMRQVDLYTLQRKQHLTTAEDFETWQSDLQTAPTQEEI